MLTLARSPGSPAAPAPSGAPGADSSIPALFATLGSSADGLSRREALRRLQASGPNEPTAAPRQALIAQILLAFANPLMIILLIAAAISAVVGEPLNAAIIVLMVALSVAINFVQTYRSQRAAESLRQSVAPMAAVRRDGAWQEVLRSTLVPGDVVRLAAGNLVPADARLLDTRDLHMQEAALTGESLPVGKAAGDPQAPNSDQNGVFLGTSVVSGTATALVYATGASTRFGDIAQRLATRAPDTAFERGLRGFSFLITRTVNFLVLFVFLVNAFLHHDPFEALLFAIALAVGLIPEFLPMITTVTLAQGALHMARQQVIVKNLAAIQNFGSIDILCSDKTGTLTSGEMTLDRHLDPLGQPAERPFLLAYLNSAHETGIQNPLDTAILQRARGNPLDAAVLSHERLDVAGYRKLGEVPFDYERRRVSVLVAQGNGEQLLIVKGAPESVLPLCTSYELDGRVITLDSVATTKCTTTQEGLNAAGFRVLAVAYVAGEPEGVLDIADEKNLTLAGFLTFADQPLADAGTAIAALARDGVQVKIISGDNELVAGHVCELVGLQPGTIVLGDELETMTDTALSAVAERTTVFARVAPAQKNRIILALKQRGHVVGYLCDVINDAPSLHAADVGISVFGAVDVARDAADIILMQAGLGVLHNGILEGRKAFGNVMKYLLMGTSSNFGNMFSMAGAALILPFLPMLPTQILLNNFLYDLAQVTIPSDNVDPSFTRKPHRWDIRLIRNFMIYIGPISSLYDFLTFYVLLNVFGASEALFHTGWFVESLATQTLVLFIIRTAGNPFKSRPSRPLTLTTLAVVGIALALPFSPLAGPLGFVPLPAGYFLFLAGSTITYLLLVEVAKRRLMRGFLD
jgi:Mg2+-importing ATPase